MQLNLRGKILAFVALPVVLVLGGAEAFRIAQLYQNATHATITRETELAKAEAAELDARLREVGRIAKDTANFLEFAPELTATQLFQLVHRNVGESGDVRTDSLVYGSAIAFSPKASPTGKLFAPYAYRDNAGKTQGLDIATAYDYTDPKWQWWHLPLKSGRGEWTDVYDDVGAGNVKMVTFSVPFRRNGEFAGVATVDVALPGLRKQVFDASADQHKMFVIGRDVRMVFAHSSEEIGARLSDLTARLGRPDLLELGQRMLREAPGNTRARGWDSAETQLMFYALVHSPEWVLGLRIDESAVYGEARARLFQSIAGFALALAIVVIGLVVVTRRVTEPIGRLDAATRRIAQGDRGIVLATEGGDEIARLSRSFNDMTRALIEREQALVAETAAREKIESELALARELQRSMLPPGEASDTAQGRYEIAAALEPARAVGGDFFDYVVRADGRLVFVVADVSDKGVPAALFMVRAHTLMRSLALRMDSPSELLAAMNDALCEENERCMFVTLACGALDLASGRLALSSAGHEPPLRVGRDGAAAWLETEGGPALGLMEGMAYPASQATLAPGDALVLYTDGISEAFDSANQAFGRERLEAAARGLAQAKVLDLCAGIFAEVRRFVAGAEQSDDITLLVVRWHGGKG